jgi:hypothetical protein
MTEETNQTTTQNDQPRRTATTASSEEQILYEGKIPWRYSHFSHGFLWFILIGWNIGILISYISSISEHVKVTSQRVVHTLGLISKHLEEVEYYRVKDTDFNQTTFQRILGVGTITLYSDDATAPKLTFPITSPKDIREKIRDFVIVERKKRRTLQMD